MSDTQKSDGQLILRLQRQLSALRQEVIEAATDCDSIAPRYTSEARTWTNMANRLRSIAKEQK